MTKKNLILMIIAVLVLLVDGTSYAAARKKKKRKADKPRSQIEQVYSNTYTRIDFGPSIPTKKLSGQYDRKFDSTVLGGVGAGFRFSDKFKTDITIQYRKFEFTSSSKISTQTLNTASFMLNGYYNILSSYKFSPYITAGAGIAHTKVGSITLTQDSNTRVIFGKKLNKFTWNIGCGINSKISKRFNIDVGYKYTDFGSIKTSSNSTLNGVVANSITPFSGKLRSHEASIGIIYNIY